MDQFHVPLCLSLSVSLHYKPSKIGVTEPKQIAKGQQCTYTNTAIERETYKQKQENKKQGYLDCYRRPGYKR